MTEPINEKVDVISKYYRVNGKGQVKIIKIRWNGREYDIKHHDYYEKRRIGRVVFHLFHVSTDTMYFCLRHDPDNLHWILERISDGSSD